MISLDEITSATRFEDEIGLFGFEDLMNHKHPECEIKDPGFYGFPYRMLLPKGCGNLLMAGRCVTTDIKAHMSTGMSPAVRSWGRVLALPLPFAPKRTALPENFPILSCGTLFWRRVSFWSKTDENCCIGWLYRKSG